MTFALTEVKHVTLRPSPLIDLVPGVLPMEPVLTIGSTIKCSQALPPGISTLLGVPTPVTAGNMPVATVMMYVPLVNIMTFGMCNSSTNPTVVLATAAAMGVHTPMPCLPVIAAPWSPGAQSTKITGQAAALKSSKCNCAWGGSISVTQTAGAPHKTA